MLRMVYASRKADPLLLTQIDINGDGEVSMEELQQTVEEDNSVLAPAFQLQRMLRQRILGVRYWEQETLRRQTYFAGYDSGTTTSWDAIRDILAIKHRERLEEEERQRRLKEMEEEQRRQEKLQKELKFKEEMVLMRRPVIVIDFHGTPRRPRERPSEPKRSVADSKRRRSERLAKRGKSWKSVAPSATRNVFMPT